MMNIFFKWKGFDREVIKIILLLLYIYMIRNVLINRYMRGYRFCIYGDYMF